MQRINNKGSRSVPVLPVLYQINRAPALAAALRQAPGLTKSLCIKGNLPIYSMYSLYGFCTIVKKVLQIFEAGRRKQPPATPARLLTFVFLRCIVKPTSRKSVDADKPAEPRPAERAARTARYGAASGLGPHPALPPQSAGANPRRAGPLQPPLSGAAFLDALPNPGGTVEPFASPRKTGGVERFLFSTNKTRRFP